MHEHTDECLNGCTHLAALNQMLANFISFNKCYTDTCVGEGTIQVVGGAKYCIACSELLPLFEKTCETLGVEPWDQPFLMFREGFLAAMKMSLG